MPLSQGQILNNRYRIVKLLGQGGFGAVYRVWDIHLERPLALKENLDTSPEAQRQFKREAQILFDLTHPNLPKVIDCFVLPEQGQYLVMEFVEGKDLQEMLNTQGGPLPEAQALPWIEQVCDALSYLHSQRPPIIHRDIKPANIKITPDGKAMLVDFGIAKIYDPGLKTTTGAQALTPGYAPFEQYGEGKTDARTDIYALGATLYTTLTGERPVESVQRTIKDGLTPPEQINPNLPTVLASVIRHAMEMDPDRRFQSAAEFKSFLLSTMRPEHVTLKPAGPALVAPARAAAERPAGQRPVAAGQRPSPGLVRWGVLGGAGLLALILVGVLVVFFSTMLLSNKTNQPDSTNAVPALATHAPGVIPSPGETLAATSTPENTRSGETLPTQPPESMVTSTMFTSAEKPADIPVMPGAKDMQVFQVTQGQSNSTMVSFSVDASQADIFAYYEREMAANGWSKTGTYSDANSQVVYYQKGERIAMVIISQSSGKMMVSINVMQK
jgi:serine/threonine protein kinase